ncbi:MAG: HD domain-containing phosphohydrolase, partial [Phycisphaeraceae bacterium]
MEKIASTKLRVGVQLEQALLRGNGEKLAELGCSLRVEHIQIVRTLPDADYYLARGPEELADAGLLERIPASEAPKEGTSAATDVVSRWGRLLLTRGQLVERHHLAGLAAGAYRSCQTGEAIKGGGLTDVGRTLMAKLAEADLESDAEAPSGRIEPALKSVWQLRSASPQASWPSEEKLAEAREQEIERVDRWFAQLVAGGPVDISKIAALIERLYQRLVDHRERFTQLALLCRRRQGYLADQAYSVAVLAMATAAQLSWSPDNVRRAGMAALFADVGMLLLPASIRNGDAKLNEEDRKVLDHHPAYSVGMLRGVDGLDAMVRRAIYQHHERENGMGYPRRCRSQHLCDLAGVLAVADVFAAATAPRFHRSAKLPYHVMEQIIRAASSGMFDKSATRGLVQAAGLFPVGSHLKLSDG